MFIFSKVSQENQSNFDSFVVTLAKRKNKSAAIPYFEISWNAVGGSMAWEYMGITRPMHSCPTLAAFCCCFFFHSIPLLFLFERLIRERDWFQFFFFFFFLTFLFPSLQQSDSSELLTVYERKTCRNDCDVLLLACYFSFSSHYHAWISVS